MVTCSSLSVKLIPKTFLPGWFWYRPAVAARPFLRGLAKTKPNHRWGRGVGVAQKVWVKPFVHGTTAEVMDNRLDAHFRHLPGWFADRRPNSAGYHVIADETAMSVETQGLELGIPYAPISRRLIASSHVCAGFSSGVCRANSCQAAAGPR